MYKVKVAVCSEIRAQHMNTMWVQYRVFFKWSQLGAHYFLVYLFQLLYMFRPTMCPSSGELTVSMRHWYFSLCMGGCLVCTILGIFISTSLHVSANYVPIIRITYCIYATLVFFTVYEWLFGLHYFLVYLFQLLYMFRPTMCPSHCVSGCLVCRPDSHPYRVKNSSVA